MVATALLAAGRLPALPLAAGPSPGLLLGRLAALAILALPVLVIVLLLLLPAPLNGRLPY